MPVFYTLIGLSYLSPIFMQPWVSAFQDLCAILALIILLSAQVFSKDIQINKAYGYAFLFILLIPITQYMTGLLYFRQELVLSTLYLLVFFLSIVTGTSLHKIANAIARLSTFFSIIAIACVALQLIQWTGIVESVLILDSSALRPSANIGQPNNLATLLFIGLFANLWRYRNQYIKAPLYLSINTFIMFGIVLTQSRTSWVVVILLLILFYGKRQLNLFGTMLKNALVFFALVIVMPYLTLFIRGNSITILDRASSDSSRLYIWKQTIIAIMDKPWFGYGWNQTSVAQTKISTTYPINVWLEYSHNMFLDIMLWVGIPIGLLIIGSIVVWFIRSYIKITTTNDLIYLSMVIAFTAHCLLEYPFAYAYFLVPIGIYIGIITYNIDNGSLDNNNFYNHKLSNNRLHKKSSIKINKLVIFGLSSMIIIVVLLVTDYVKLVGKRNLYAQESLFSEKVTSIKPQLLLLDAIDLNNDILFLSDCYVLQNNPLKSLENIYYRYPSNKNLIMFYKASIYNQQKATIPLNYMDLKFRDKSANFELNDSCL